MVDVTVGKDDGSHRSLVQMLSGKVQGAAGGLNGGQRVDHNPAPLARDQAHICQIKTPHLVNPRAHLKQAGAVVQPLLAPETGIHRIRCIAADEIVAGAIPGQGVIKPRHLQLLCRGDQPALGIRTVIESAPARQSLAQHLIGSDRGRRGRAVAIGVGVGG